MILKLYSPSGSKNRVPYSSVGKHATKGRCFAFPCAVILYAKEMSHSLICRFIELLKRSEVQESRVRVWMIPVDSLGFACVAKEDSLKMTRFFYLALFPTSSSLFRSSEFSA